MKWLQFLKMKWLYEDNFKFGIAFCIVAMGVLVMVLAAIFRPVSFPGLLVWGTLFCIGGLLAFFAFVAILMQFVLQKFENPKTPIVLYVCEADIEAGYRQMARWQAVIFGLIIGSGLFLGLTPTFSNFHDLVIDFGKSTPVNYVINIKAPVVSYILASLAAFATLFYVQACRMFEDVRIVYAKQNNPNLIIDYEKHNWPNPLPVFLGCGTIAIHAFAWFSNVILGL